MSYARPITDFKLSYRHMVLSFNKGKQHILFLNERGDHNYPTTFKVWLFTESLLNRNLKEVKEELYDEMLELKLQGESQTDSHPF